MVKRLLQFFGKDFGGIHETAYLLGAFALMSQVLGLVRDRLLAHSFGASHSLDLYYASFRIPDLLFVSVAAFASATVLIPFFIEHKNKSNEEAKKFLDDVFTLFFFVMAVASLVAFILMPYLSKYVAPGFSLADQNEMVFLSRVLLLSPFFLGLSNMAGSVTQAFNKFFVFAFAPVLYNVGIIIGILFLYPLFGVRGVVFGVVIGAFLDFAVMIPTLLETGFFPAFSRRINFQSLKRIATVSLPRTIALSIGNVSILVLITFASLVSEGAISIFQFSFNLQSVPLSIIGVSYSVAAFPELSRLFSLGETQKFIDKISLAAKHIIFWSLPVVFLFIVLRAQIVRVILGSGHFTWSATMLTAASLAVFTISLVAQSLVLLLTRGYYAAGFTKKPLIINACSSLLVVVLAYVLLHIYGGTESVKYFFETLLKINNVVGSGVIMLSLAFTLGTILNAVLLWIFFQRDFGRFSEGVGQAVSHSFVASFVIGTVAFQMLKVFALIFNTNTLVGIFLQGFCSGVIGIFAGVIVLTLFDSPELYTVSASLKNKFWKSHPQSPGQEELF